MTDIIGIGASFCDTLMMTASYPQQNTISEAGRSLMQGSGACATALTAACRLGESATYFGTAGDDFCGRFMLKDFSKYGVDTHNVVIKAGCDSARSVTLLDSESKTLTTVYSEGSAPALTPAELNLSAINKAKVLMLDGHHFDPSIHAARYAHLHGLKVSLQIDVLYPGIERLLPFVNFLIASEEFALKLTAQSDAETAASMLMAQYRPELVILTQGAKGGFTVRYKQPIVRYSAYGEDTASCDADAVFHGAFVSCFLRGESDYYACAEFAGAAAAIKRACPGSREGLPSYEEVLAFMKEKENA